MRAILGDYEFEYTKFERYENDAYTWELKPVRDIPKEYLPRESEMRVGYTVRGREFLIVETEDRELWYCLANNHCVFSDGTHRFFLLTAPRKLRGEMTLQEAAKILEVRYALQ